MSLKSKKMAKSQIAIFRPKTVSEPLMKGEVALNLHKYDPYDYYDPQMHS